MATNYNFAESSFYEFIKGSTHPGRTYAIKVNGTYIDITDASIDIWFRRNNVTGKIIEEFEIGTGITVLDASNGKFQLDSFIIDWNKGLYYYDIKITWLTGVVKKYVWGNVSIKEDSTD